jgi:hypothetical protein
MVTVMSEVESVADNAKACLYLLALTLALVACAFKSGVEQFAGFLTLLILIFLWVNE